MKAPAPLPGCSRLQPHRNARRGDNALSQPRRAIKERVIMTTVSTIDKIHAPSPMQDKNGEPVFPGDYVRCDDSDYTAIVLAAADKGALVLQLDDENDRDPFVSAMFNVRLLSIPPADVRPLLAKLPKREDYLAEPGDSPVETLPQGCGVKGPEKLPEVKGDAPVMETLPEREIGCGNFTTTDIGKARDAVGKPDLSTHAARCAEALRLYRMLCQFDTDWCELAEHTPELDIEDSLSQEAQGHCNSLRDSFSEILKAYIYTEAMANTDGKVD